MLLYDHLVDPRPALAEAHRVLQPGGRLVLVSIDNDAWLVDSDTPTILRRILPAWADSVANTWMGRRSRSLLLEAGFADVFVEMRAGVFTSYDEIGGALDAMARIATASGALSHEEAETWRTEQRRRGGVDRLFVACPFVYTWARRT